jgi:phosphomannomutase/phosphoglucomutase
VECPDDLKVKLMDKIIDVTRDYKVDTKDGVKIFTEEGWVIIRPSGTEPIFRCFSEAKNEEDAERMAEWGVSLILEHLNL